MMTKKLRETWATAVGIPLLLDCQTTTDVDSIKGRLVSSN